MNSFSLYLLPLDQRARQLRAANEAAAAQSLIRELQYWTAEAKAATPNSDRWHECMDELDTVKTLMRKS